MSETNTNTVASYQDAAENAQEKSAPAEATTNTETDNPAENSTDGTDFTWVQGDHPGQQTIKLSKRLAETGELFRTADDRLIWLKPEDKPRHIDNPIQLEGFIRKHLKVEVTLNGIVKGCSIPVKELSILLKTPALQEDIPVVDHITDVVTYGSNWNMTKPGYNNGQEGERFYYTGSEVVPAKEPIRIREFLAALSFKNKHADAANTVALGLTVLLRHKFPGCKPFAAVTANRSHAGKDTVLDFAARRTRRVEISWGKADWALQNEAVSALADPCIGFLILGNVRAGNSIIESAFIERLVTSPSSVLQSSKRSGDGYSRKGDFIVGCSANQGRFSTDLLNRALPISLELCGNLENRSAPLGDLRNEYLPLHRAEIEAEFCGMIEKWKEAGRPLDETVKHPMKEWARTIGGILKANGFKEFLSNWTLERSVQDRVTEALGILAHAANAVLAAQATADNSRDKKSEGWLRVSEIREIAENQGIISDLIESKLGAKKKPIERQLGILLSGHNDNTVVVDVNDEDEHQPIRYYTIERRRIRNNGVNPSMCYRFKPVKAS